MKPFIKRRGEDKEQLKLVNDPYIMQIDNANNLVKILSKIALKCFYGFSWLNMTLSGRSYLIRIKNWPNDQLAAG